MKDWEDLSRAIVDSGPFTLGAEIWARSGFRCEYCSADILTSPQTYMFAQSDHILPVSKYPQYRDDFNNYAHTCGMCNQLKRNWDPLENETAPLHVPMPEELRAELIERCEKYLKPLATQKQSDVETLRRLLSSHLERIG